MLHTVFNAPAADFSLAISTQRASELAALTPTPSTAVWFLDLALETCVAAQVGLLTSAAAASVSGATGGLPGLVVSALDLQLHTAAARHAEAAWVGASLLGTQQLGVSVSTARGAWLLESCDLWLLVAELTAVSWAVLAVAVGGGIWLRTQVGYDALVTLCQQRGLSIAEIFSLVTFVAGFLVFDMFVIMAEDDALEAISYMFGGVIVAALVLLLVAVDVQYYFMISAISSGEATLRVFYTDIVNNGLCLLRIFFCWIRYLFYDLQAELVDFVFHYTETAEESLLEVAPGARLWADASLDWSELGALWGAALLFGFDAVAMLVQLLIGAFKLALALFLFWLILDLFLLRTIARTETLGWTAAQPRTPSRAAGRSAKSAWR